MVPILPSRIALGVFAQWIYDACCHRLSARPLHQNTPNALSLKLSDITNEPISSNIITRRSLCWHYLWERRQLVPSRHWPLLETRDDRCKLCDCPSSAPSCVRHRQSESVFCSCGRVAQWRNQSTWLWCGFGWPDRCMNDNGELARTQDRIEVIFGMWNMEAIWFWRQNVCTKECTCVPSNLAGRTLNSISPFFSFNHFPSAQMWHAL